MAVEERLRVKKIIVEERIYRNDKLIKTIRRIFGRREAIAWKIIGWFMSLHPKIENRLRGNLVLSDIHEEEV